MMDDPLGTAPRTAGEIKQLEQEFREHNEVGCSGCRWCYEAARQVLEDAGMGEPAERTVGKYAGGPKTWSTPWNRREDARGTAIELERSIPQEDQPVAGPTGDKLSLQQLVQYAINLAWNRMTPIERFILVQFFYSPWPVTQREVAEGLCMTQQSVSNKRQKVLAMVHTELVGIRRAYIV